MPVIFEAPKRVKKQKDKEVKKRAKDERPLGQLVGKYDQQPQKKELDHLARGHPLSAFLVRPLDVRFAAQEEKEEIVLLLRRHPITNLPWIAFLIVLLFVPPFIFPLFTFFKIFPPNLPASLKFIGTLFWYLACFSFFLINFLLWYFNVNLITNERIIDIDFQYLLYKETTATRLTQVEDVTYKMAGIICTLFDFGDVFVHTAGPEQNIEFLCVPKPAEVTKAIIKLMGGESES